MHPSWYLSWLFLALGVAAQNDLNTVSLGTDTAWLILRNCAANCIWGVSGSVADVIDCPAPWYNQCVCSLNQQSMAAAHVSNCVTTACSGTSDVSTAVAVYIQYCSSAGYALATQVNAVATQSDFNTVSLFADNEFKVLRSCAQNCIWGVGGSVADFIGCREPWYNQCVCNPKMQSSAAANVGRCVTAGCTGTSDVSTAMEVYLNYCASAGYQTAQATALTTTVPAATTNTVGGTTETLSASSGQSPVVLTYTQTATARSPSGSGGGGGGGGGLSTSDKIALGVGIGFGVPTVFVPLILYCMRHRHLN